jgi:hypothetical protein
MPAIAVVGFAAMGAIALPNAARAAAVEQPAIVLPAAGGASMTVDAVGAQGETPIMLAAVSKVVRNNGSGGAGANTGNKGGGVLRGTTHPGGGGGGNKGGNKGGTSNNQGGGANQAALGGKTGKGGKGKGGTSNSQGGGTQTGNAGGTTSGNKREPLATLLACKNNPTGPGCGKQNGTGGNSGKTGTQTGNAGGTGQGQGGNKGGKGKGIAQGPGNGPGSKGQGGKGQGIAQGPNGKGGKGKGIAQGPNAKGGKNGPPNVNINVTVINNRTVNIFRGPRRIFVGGAWTTLIAATALTPLVIGSTYFDPDGYVPVAEPVCRGQTPEGCTLNWQSVPTDGGGTNTQCVQYCRRGRTVPVAQPQALTSYAEAPAGCSLVIYAEPNFGGQSAPTSDNQPDLSSVGWDKAISSIEVQAGSWDFFTVDNFGGDSMQLTPGKYGNLDADWNKQISSFMCSQAPK